MELNRQTLRTFTINASDAAVATYLQSTRNDTIAGVPVVFGIPKGVDNATSPANTKLLLYLHGGGEGLVIFPVLDPELSQYCSYYTQCVLYTTIFPLRVHSGAKRAVGCLASSPCMANLVLHKKFHSCGCAGWVAGQPEHIEPFA